MCMNVCVYELSLSCPFALFPYLLHHVFCCEAKREFQQERTTKTTLFQQFKSISTKNAKNVMAPNVRLMFDQQMPYKQQLFHY